MITKIIPKYLQNEAWPICQDSYGRKRKATDNWGDIECPFCDHVICAEGCELKINDKCSRCNAKIIEFKPFNSTLELKKWTC
jgi:hypothetical protein